MAGIKVLIIEDRRENIVFLANNVLRPRGYEIITAMDGEQGLKRALVDRPDLIIMDLNMPKRDGLEVMAALREQHSAIPVILTTFYGSEQVAQQAYRLGASGYVVKPYTANEMMAAVEKALSAQPQRQKQAEPPEALSLARQIERWMRDMNILNNIGKSLVAQLDLDSVLARAVEAATYVSRADQGFLFLAPEEGEGALSLRATRGPDERQMRVLDRIIDSPLAAQTLSTARATRRDDAHDERGLAEIAGRALGPLLAAPLRWRRRPIGVLVAARNPGDPAFRDTDAEWLIGLADYVAIAVSNALEFQRRPVAAPGPSTAGGPAARQEMEKLAAELEAAAQRIRRMASG